LQKDFFQDYKSLFNEKNNILILDEYTKTHCIFGDTHITLISDLYDKENENDIKDNNNCIASNNYEDYITAFYSIFLNAYDIIKFINDKKLRKYNKLDIIYNKKILQVKDGKIQIKKINYDKSSAGGGDEKKNISHNFLKIKELFKCENSYPVISFYPGKETEINNLSFLFYTFEEIFLSKRNRQETKETIIKKIIKFFRKNKNAKFCPIIFNTKYFEKLIQMFNNNRKDSRVSILSSSSSIQEEKKKILFHKGVGVEALPGVPKSEKNGEGVSFEKIIEEKREICENLIGNIYIFKFNSDKFSKNEIGKLFKYNRIKINMNAFCDKAKIVNENKKDNFLCVGEICEEAINDIMRKNKKKIKPEENKENEYSAMKKYFDEKECIIF